MSFFQNASNKNLEITILLKIAQRSDNNNSRVNIASQSPRAGVVSYVLGAYMVLVEWTLV